MIDNFADRAIQSGSGWWGGTQKSQEARVKEKKNKPHSQTIDTHLTACRTSRTRRTGSVAFHLAGPVSTASEAKMMTRHVNLGSHPSHERKGDKGTHLSLATSLAGKGAFPGKVGLCRHVGHARLLGFYDHGIGQSRKAVGDGTDVATASMEEKGKITITRKGRRRGKRGGARGERERDEREGEWGSKGTRKVRRRWPPQA